MDDKMITGENPIKLCANRVWRTYWGGKFINQWKDMTDESYSQFPEEWIASLISARNRNENTK
jgi:mannose-6-phosphate isomerase